MVRRLLVSAAAAGLLTGAVALSGHPAAVAAHAAGGLLALALVVVAVRRARKRPVLSLVGAMVLANLTGVAWTVWGTAGVVVAAHVITGVFASAGALVLAASR